jgi:hypothetical protein
MTIPTGLGLVRGPESADQPGTPIGNHAAFAARNNASAVKGETSDPCYCGCCSMTDARWK